MRRAPLVVVVAALAIAGCRGGGAATEKMAAASRLPNPYPIEPFAGLDLDGRRVSLTDFRNHVVIVNVWATWCAPCRRELPVLNRLQEKYRDRLRVLGLLQDNVSDEFARRFVAQAGVSFPVVRSSSEIEQRLPAVLVIPMSYVIDAEGRMVSMFAGEADPKSLEQEVIRLTARAPSTP